MAYEPAGTAIAITRTEAEVAEPRDTPIRIPATDSEAEHDRVRRSNDRDQQREREGKTSRHNEGYDEAADGQVRAPHIEQSPDE